MDSLSTYKPRRYKILIPSRFFEFGNLLFLGIDYT